MIALQKTIDQTRANKALVPTAGAAFSSMLSGTLTRYPVSTLTPAPAGGTALTLAKKFGLAKNSDFPSANSVIR